MSDAPTGLAPRSPLDRLVVSVQLMLEAVIVLGAPAEFFALGSGLALGASWLRVVVGVVVFVAGLLVMSAAKRDLAGNLTTAPTPRQGGSLVDTGIYARLRHPMYLGVLGVSLGWALAWGSWLALGGTAVMTVLLVLKSRYEDRLLSARYPGYAEYRRRVRGGVLPRP